MELKKGYNLIMLSYEGDADNYNTTINTFSTKEECIFYTKLAIALGHGKSDFSKTCVEIYERILSEHGTDDIKKEYAEYKLASDDIYSDNKQIYYITDIIIDFLGCKGEDYWDRDYQRVYNGHKIYYLSEDPEIINI